MLQDRPAVTAQGLEEEDRVAQAVFGFIRLVRDTGLHCSLWHTPPPPQTHTTANLSAPKADPLISARARTRTHAHSHIHTDKHLSARAHTRTCAHTHPHTVVLCQLPAASCLLCALSLWHRDRGGGRPQGLGFGTASFPVRGGRGRRGFPVCRRHRHAVPRPPRRAGQPRRLPAGGWPRALSLPRVQRGRVAAVTLARFPGYLPGSALASPTGPRRQSGRTQT